MVEATVSDARWRLPSADAALKAAAQVWFLVAIAGQWAFVYYIVGFYAGPTLRGHFQTWSRNTDLIKGYVAGDGVGNLYFAAHVLIAALITTSGAFQLFPRIRARAPSFHRWNGRIYILAAFLMATGGLWMVWVRGTFLTIYGAAGSTLLGAMIMICAAMTLRSAMARRIDAHQRWAMRTFLLVNGVWFQRLGYNFWIILNQGPVGIGDRMDGPFDIIWGFGAFLFPLAVFELYRRARDHASAGGKSAMAAALLVLAIVTGVGIYGAYMFMWRPVLAKV